MWVRYKRRQARDGRLDCNVGIPICFSHFPLLISHFSIPTSHFSFLNSHFPLPIWCRRPESNRYDLEGPQDFKSCASANSATSACLNHPNLYPWFGCLYLAPKSGFEPPTYRLTAGCSTVELLRNSIFAATYSPRLLPSTISAEGLNFCVRYGNRCIPFAFATKNFWIFLGFVKDYSLKTAQWQFSIQYFSNLVKPSTY